MKSLKNKLEKRTCKLVVTGLLTAVQLIISTACAARPKEPAAGPAQSSPTNATTAAPDVVNPLNEIHFSSQALDPAANTPQAVENWSRWPSVSTAPFRQHINMDLYRQPGRLPLPLTGVTVVVDAGHGGKDPGAIGTAADGSPVYEKVLNLQIAEQIRPRLEALGATVLMTRTDDSWVSLYRRVAIGADASLRQWLSAGQAAGLDTNFINPLIEQLQTVYNINDDEVEVGGRGMFQGLGVNSDVRLLLDLERQTENIIFLSVHCNSTSESSSGPSGCLVYYCTNDSIFNDELMTLNSGLAADIEPLNPNYTGYDDASRIRLATAIQAGVVAAVPELNNPDMSPIHTGNFAFIRETNLTSVLLECGYMSHSDDLALLCDQAVQARIAEGATQGILAYFTEQPKGNTGNVAGQPDITETGGGQPTESLPATPADIPTG